MAVTNGEKKGQEPQVMSIWAAFTLVSFVSFSLTVTVPTDDPQSSEEHPGA